MPTPLRDDQVIAVLRAVYGAAPSFAAWRDRLMNAVRGMHDGARSCTWFEYDWSFADDGLALDALHSSVVRGPDVARDSWLVARQKVPAPLRLALFGRTGAATASQGSGLGNEVRRAPAWRELWREPVVDSFGMVAVDPRGHGACVSVGLPEVRAYAPRERRILARLAVHMAAGLRLQRTPRASRAGATPLDQAEAVLTPQGVVLHATGAARTRRASLEEGGRRRRTALSTARDADRALAVWRGLLDGRWSLVDHLDTDGKRFLVALRNDPQLDRRVDLSPRERQVTALVALGHRDKEIAYSLGLSMAAVTAAVQRAKTKLGLTSRAALAASWRGEQTEAGVR